MSCPDITIMVDWAQNTKLLTDFLGGNASWSNSFTGAQVDQELCCALCCNCDHRHRCLFTPSIRHGAFTAEPFTSKGLTFTERLSSLLVLLSALGIGSVASGPLAFSAGMPTVAECWCSAESFEAGFGLFLRVCWSKHVTHVAPAWATEFFLYFSCQLLCCNFQLKSSFLSFLVVAVPFLTSLCIFAVNHG